MYKPFRASMALLILMTNAYPGTVIAAQEVKKVESNHQSDQPEEPPSINPATVAVLTDLRPEAGLTTVVIGKSRETEQLEAAKIEADKKAEADRIEAERIKAIAEKAAQAAYKAQEAARIAEPKQTTVRTYAEAPAPPSDLRSKARAMVDARWGDEHWNSFDFIVTHESGWNLNARNASSGACGLGQALPCSKMGGMGEDNQLNWIMGYIADRYGSPNNAAAFWRSHNWY